MEEKKFPQIGIGIMILNSQQEVLLGLRQGSHGAGEWSMPGGRLEWGEQMMDCARREVKEETGLEVGGLELISIADELRYIYSHNKHFVNIGFLAQYISGEPRLTEPDKWIEWGWFKLDTLPKKLFEGTELVINNYLAKRIYHSVKK